VEGADISDVPVTTGVRATDRPGDSAPDAPDDATADRRAGTYRQPGDASGATGGDDLQAVPGEGVALRRVVIENVRPNVDEGRFPIKRILGDRIEVQADAFADGHDVIEVRLLHRHVDDAAWSEVELEGPDNDRWWGSFTVDRLGRFQYTVQAWADRFSSWQRDLRKRIDAGQDVAVDLRIGAALIDAAAERAAGASSGADADLLRAWAAALSRVAAGQPTPADPRFPAPTGPEAAFDPGATAACRRHADRRHATTWEPPLEVVVDPERARFSAWYELFPRSTSPDPARHGTFRDVVARLDYIAGLGFDVLYLPPIHPIGASFRKGRNNAVEAAADDPGSPWAIGSAVGGHTAINPALGSLAEFRALVGAARDRGLNLALDIAFQAAPDHPWVREHRAWFRSRPDGTIQYAENPPKKYQDIVPFDFESEDWRGLWIALRDVFRFWIGEGVTIFRVDNPHTKAFPFWEWCIAEIKRDHPEVLFLAEAFTRPKPMYRLAKLGFSQSYTYFTWRNTPADLAAYVTELTTTDVREFFRPNFWPNTPDILHADLQEGGRPMFAARFVLAATLSSNYGIYGPAFELGVNVPREAGSEEYLDSEKYEQRTWDLEDPGSLRGLISTVNRLRHEHPALQRMARPVFHGTGNGRLLAYSRHAGDDWVLAVVSFDPHGRQGGTVDLDLEAFGLAPGASLAVREVRSGERRTLRSGDVVELDPDAGNVLLFVAATTPEANR
jgi:starch synthase (maltosyl-transferring)